MKHPAIVLGAVASIFLSSVSVLSAGVIMSETAIRSGPIANIAQQRTIYIQGNKQRVDTADVQTITDLDKRLLYIVDKTLENMSRRRCRLGAEHTRRAARRRPIVLFSNERERRS
jgi:hypothetical protein